MRRHSRMGGAITAHGAKHAGPKIPDTLRLIRSFDSEVNPAQPQRPSPLSASQIQDMPLDLLDRIRSFPLFLSAPDTFLAAIAKHLRPQMHSANDYVVTEGDEARSMFWLVRGAVAVTSRDGESTYAELKSGAFFGEIGILMDIPRTATIIARTRCLLVVLKKEDLMKELPNFPTVEQSIREEAQERLSILQLKKKEAQSTRADKRPREGTKGQVSVGDQGIMTSVGPINHKKRKSPSPGLVELPISSALGTGAVNVRQLLKELPLFSSLPAELLHFLGLNAQPISWPPFTDIIRQDSQGRDVYFIVTGEVEVIDEKAARPSVNGHSAKLRSNAGPIVRARLRHGQYFGEVASLSLAPRRTATVRSVTSVECLVIRADVLDELWTKFPQDIRHQVEETAKARLHSVKDVDVPMIDSETATPQIDELAIAELPHRSAKKAGPSAVTLSQYKADPTQATAIAEINIAEPVDPDPFLGTELDSRLSRSRRGSLAPVQPETDQNDLSEPSGPQQIPRTKSPLSLKYKLHHANRDQRVYAKRPRTIQRRPSEYSKGLLPDKILIKVFQYLDICDLMRLRRVSIYWAKLLNTSPDLVHHLDLTPFNRKLTDDVLINRICPFVGCRPRTVDISNCFHLTDDGFKALANSCGPSVHVWRMKSVWDITAQTILDMANTAKELEEIDLSNCRKVSDTLLARVVGWVVPEPPPESQQSSPDPNTNRPGFTQAAPGAVIGCPKLKRLTLSYCKHVTDRSMAHLAVHASPRLEAVDLTRCTTITDQGFQHWSIYQFPNLTKLCLADCTYLTDNAIVYLTNAAKSLKELDLSFCCALSDTATEVLALGCPLLTSLNLSFCGSAVSDSSLRSIGLHLLDLQFLSVRGCVRVTGTGVEAITENCPKLEEFDVSQCKNLIPWLDAGGIQRSPERVKFNTVAKGR